MMECRLLRKSDLVTGLVLPHKWLMQGFGPWHCVLGPLEFVVAVRYHKERWVAHNLVQLMLKRIGLPV